MNDLNVVPKTGSFGNSVDVINQNFILLKDALEQAAYSNMGFFQTEALLTSSYPDPEEGWVAYVGATKKIYMTQLVSGSYEWYDTGLTDSSTVNVNYVGYQFMGVATPSTNPGTPEQKVFYIGGAGTYANFGTSVTVPVGSICVFKYNGSWVKEQIALFAGIDDVPTAGSDNLVKSGGVAKDFKEIIGIESSWSIRNGSQGNSANAWVVTIYGKGTIGIIGSCGNKIRITVNKSLPENYYYFYNIVTYNKINPSTLNSDKVRDLTSDAYRQPIDTIFELIEEEKSFSIQLAAYKNKNSSQSDGNCYPLRATDFSEGDIKIEVGDFFLESLRKDFPELSDFTHSKCLEFDSYNELLYQNLLIGSTPVQSQTKGAPIYPVEGELLTCVNKELIPVVGGHTITYHCGGRIPDTLHVYVIVLDSNKGYVSNYYTEGTISRSINLPSNAAYIRYTMIASLVENAYIKDDTTNEVIWSPAVPTPKQSIIEINETLQTLPTEIDSINEEIDSINEKIDSINEKIDGVKYEITNIRNGSQGNAGNVWVVTLIGKDTLVIPVIPRHKYRLVMDKEPESGYTFFLAIDYYNKTNPANLYSDIVRNNVNSILDWITISEPFDVKDGEYGISIQIIEQIVRSATNSSPNTIALRNTDFQNVSIKLVDVTESIEEKVSELDERVSGLEEIVDTSIVGRNEDKIPMLVNSCRYHKQSLSSKDFQALICADSHGWELSNINAIAATNGFNSIDVYIHVGDAVGSYPTTSQVSAFKKEFEKLSKHGYIVVGNHDVGNSYLVAKCLTHAMIYTHFIKPMVDAGYLVSGEYTENIPYWYHDDTTYKIRIIGIYEYDEPLDLDTEYWSPVEYDSSYPMVRRNTAYQVGDKVNGGFIYNYTDTVTSYTEYSFECVQAVTTPTNEYGTGNAHKFPSYKIFRGNRVIRQVQAQWLLDTLASTPADYGVLIITHNPFSDTAVSLDKKFSWPANELGSTWTQSCMQTNFIKNAIAAFKSGTNYSEKVIMKGDAAYLNILNDGSIDYAYEVSKDFSLKNTGVYLIGLIGGHCHRDIIWKDGDIYQVSPNCAIVDAENDRNGDIRRTRVDGIAADSLTVASFANGRIGLVKLGVNVTENCTFRDYEVIDTTT